MQPVTVEAIQGHLDAAHSDRGEFEALVTFFEGVAHHLPERAPGLTNVKVLARCNHLAGGLKVAKADMALVRHSHDRFLPVAKAYREYRAKAVADPTLKLGEDPDFESLRGSLGWASKELYRLQRETMNALLDLIIPWPWSLSLTPARRTLLWEKWVKAERRWMSAARAQG